MTDWKAVGLGALLNVVLTVVLTIAVFPLFFLGPVLGGFLAAYMNLSAITSPFVMLRFLSMFSGWKTRLLKSFSESFTM